MKTIEPIPTLALDDLLSIAASAIEDLLEHTDPNTSYYSGVWADVPGKLRAAMLQELQKSAGVSNNCRSSENVQVVRGLSGAIPATEPVRNGDVVATAPVNDATSGKPLTITLPDISSKAFWSGSGKGEVFHPETYRRWAKEAIERYCAIARIDVEVK